MAPRSSSETRGAPSGMTSTGRTHARSTIRTELPETPHETRSVHPGRWPGSSVGEDVQTAGPDAKFIRRAVSSPAEDGMRMTRIAAVVSLIGTIAAASGGLVARGAQDDACTRAVPDSVFAQVPSVDPAYRLIPDGDDSADVASAEK